MTLKEEIQNGESRTLEYKLELPQDNQKWIKTIIAFANGAGGKFVIGVNNKRQIKGVPAATDVFELKDGIADKIGQLCDPQIMFDVYQESVGDKTLIIIQVFPGNSTPYYLKALGKENGTFVRLGATTRNADLTTLDELELRKKRKSYDELPNLDLEVTDTDIKYLCNDFSKRTGKKITKETLLNLHLFGKKDGKLVATNAYAIFLGKHDYLSRIQCARFKGTDRVKFIDKKDFSGPLLEQVENAYNFVLGHINMGITIDGLYRKEQYELPEKAIRELILNAVIHRNYMMNSSVQMAVYDDRLEVSSPGSLYGTLTLAEALAGRSSIRNKVIAEVCDKLDVIEGWGTGLKRIIASCNEMGIAPPEFLEIGDLFRINFYRPSYAKSDDKATINSKNGDKATINIKGDDKATINMSYQEKIMTYVAEHPHVKTQDIALHIGLKLTRTKEYIYQLVEEEKLVPFGSNRNRTYSVKGQDK
ncbi:MAG: putative DNA binding domain-containing protein [Spirochaetia bacterium]|nr:putative DNA binding domain-containing protein [Spirochaetia bacterium]